LPTVVPLVFLFVVVILVPGHETTLLVALIGLGAASFAATSAISSLASSSFVVRDESTLTVVLASAFVDRLIVVLAPGLRRHLSFSCRQC
jgi:hypothetical protein